MGAYRLAGSSNLGSLVGLLSYPLLFEPWLPLPHLIQAWQVEVTLIGGVGVPLCAWLGRGPAVPRDTPQEGGTPSWGQRSRWILLAAIPTGLLASTTLILTTNLSPVPWLWSVPLALYLLSHILAFTRPAPTLAGADLPAQPGLVDSPSPLLLPPLLADPILTGRVYSWPAGCCTVSLVARKTRYG